MFETAELGRTVSKDEYRARESRLRTELLDLQTRLHHDGTFPLLVLINGVDGAGKGETVNLLHEWMDPRFLQAVAFGPPTDEEAARPLFWRYWRALAPRGQTGIYFGNWYTPTVVGRAERHLKKGAFLGALARIRQFEQALVDDGALVVKLWFHLGKAQQAKVYQRLRGSKATRWRVSAQDIERHEKYDRYREISEEVVRETSTSAAPWTVIEAADRRYRELAVGETLVAALTARLDVSPVEVKRPGRSPPSITGRNILDTVDLTTTTTRVNYERKLPGLQRTLNNAVAGLAKQGRSVVIVFEGWDAAGKGGAIRRVTGALDARDYRVIPIAAPTDEERAQHYLWRFWRDMPARGQGRHLRPLLVRASACGTRRGFLHPGGLAACVQRNQ